MVKHLWLDDLLSCHCTTKVVDRVMRLPKAAHTLTHRIKDRRSMSSSYVVPCSPNKRIVKRIMILDSAIDRE